MRYSEVSHHRPGTDEPEHGYEHAHGHAHAHDRTHDAGALTTRARALTAGTRTHRGRAHYGREVRREVTRAWSN